ncbi:MAG: DUF507 family protein [Deltaproteobacteria bacterium]|nr:MAG: DUF507 family protein [Deltaproteobacteria bacterium]
MSLKKEEIKTLSIKILRFLKSQNLIKPLVGEDKIEAKIEAVFQKNLDEEATIERDARKLMDQYKSQIASGAIDSQKAFTMIKKQLIKERKFIL